MQLLHRFGLTATPLSLVTLVFAYKAILLQADTLPDYRCSNTALPWMSISNCRCYGVPPGIANDSCEFAIINPEDDESILISACYEESGIDCTQWNGPCGRVVRLDRPCDEEGSHTVTMVFDDKPPCGGTTGYCSDTAVPPSHFP